MHKDAAMLTFFSRVFYGLLHAFVLLIVFTYENSFLSECDAFSWECISFTILKLLAIYLFFTIEKHQSIILFSTELPPVEWERPVQPHCEICNLTLAFRTRHCKKCEKCINQYDHHCFWVGCCIGELNHFRFTMYLLTESLCVWWIFYISFSGLIEGSEGYGAFVVNIALCFMFGTMISSMCMFHIYLISTGSTTWEALSRYKIPYFQPYPKTVNPFSSGCLQNWKHAILVKSLTQWDLPQPLPHYIYPFNWCDNEYYSCC